MALDPFHVVPGASPGAGRLLLITYHFPPGGAAGALRWQKLAGFLAAEGWRLDVITLDPSLLPSRDDARLADLPAGTRVFGVRPRTTLTGRIDAWRGRMRARRAGAAGPRDAAPQPASATRPAESLEPHEYSGRYFRPATWRRAWAAWLIHRRDMAWADAAAEAGRELARSEKYRVVLSSGPPHLAHEAARRASVAAGAPLVVDYRDPWSFSRRLPESIASPLYLWLARRDESRVLKRAALVLANTPALARELTRQRKPRRVETVMNGVDAESVPPPAAAGRFSVVYAGTIYLDRDPRPFFAAAGKFARAHGLGADQFRIELIGNVAQFGGRDIGQLAEEQGLAPGLLDVVGYLSRADLFRHLAAASVLLSLPQDSAFAIPSKVFEYMSFEAWLLVLADRGTPVAELLEGSGALVVPPDDEGAIREALERCWRSREQGARPPRLAADARYSRAGQAARLVAALRDLDGRAG